MNRYLINPVKCGCGNIIELENGKCYKDDDTVFCSDCGTEWLVTV